MTIQFMDEMKAKSADNQPQTPQINKAYDTFIKQQKKALHCPKRGRGESQAESPTGCHKAGAVRTDNQGKILPGQDAQIAAIQEMQPLILILMNRIKATR